MLARVPTLGSATRVVPAAQVARRRAEPDQIHVLRVEAERNEIQVGGQRLETRRVNVVAASAAGGRVQVHQRQRVEIRLQGSGTGMAGASNTRPGDRTGFVRRGRRRIRVHVRRRRRRVHAAAVVPLPHLLGSRCERV